MMDDDPERRYLFNGSRTFQSFEITDNLTPLILKSYNLKPWPLKVTGGCGIRVWAFGKRR